MRTRGMQFSWLTVITITLIASTFLIAQTKPKPKPKPSPKPTAAATPKPIPTPPVVTDPAKCIAPNGLTLAEIATILDAHNAARAEQQLPPVTWNCRLASLAHEWASKSIYEHREDNPYGENIFVSGLSNEPATSVVTRWLFEKPNWNNDTATCTPGKVCTHYTQIMWRPTKSIGCSTNRQATGKWKSIFVCNYDIASKDNSPAW